jgi:hypothetical protein
MGDEDLFKKMNEAAAKAEEKLKELPQDSVKIVAAWWKANYNEAGHKRLGRILITYAGD